MNLKFSQQGTYCTLLHHRARGVKFKEDYQGRGTLLKENSLHRCYCCWVLGEADTRSAARVHVVELWAVSAGIHPVVRVRLLWTCFYTDLLPLNIYTTSSRVLKANKRIDKQLFVLTCTSHFLPCFLFFWNVLYWQQEAPPQENLSLHKQAACEIFFFFFFCSCAVLLSFCDHWLLSLRLFSFHSLGRWRHQRDQHHPCGQGGLRESWCLSVWTAQSPGTGILWQGNLLLLFRFLSILTTCLFFSSSFATLTPQPTKIVASLTVFLVFVIFLGGIFLKNYFAGVPGTKGDSSRCQPALCHEGPQEGHTKRYSNVRLGYGREILRIATFLCFGFWLHWQGKKTKKSEWVGFLFCFFVFL